MRTTLETRTGIYGFVVSLRNNEVMIFHRKKKEPGHTWIVRARGNDLMDNFFNAVDGFPDLTPLDVAAALIALSLDDNNQVLADLLRSQVLLVELSKSLNAQE